MTYFPAIQVYVSARSRGCATARAEDGAGGGPLTQLRAVPQQGRVAASKQTYVYVRSAFIYDYRPCRVNIIPTRNAFASFRHDTP